MAKLTGPLFSMSATGKYAGALVFTRWRGRSVARKLVTPSNPRTSAQTDARNAVAVAAVAQHWASNTAQKRSGQTATDRALLAAAAPSGQAWNGFFVKSMIGGGALTYAAATAAYNALTAAEKTAWGNAAAALVPPITAAPQHLAGGALGTPIAAGQVHYISQYGLYAAGVATQPPTGTPPTYA